MKTTDERTSELQAAEDKILACVHCGFCLSACPTYTRLGDEADSPRGRVYLMRAVAEGRLAPDDPAFDLHIGQCLGCRACEPVCPSGVQYGFLVERARATLARSVGLSRTARLLLFAFGNNMMRPLVSALGRLLRATWLPAVLVRLLPFERLRLALAMLMATRPLDMDRIVGPPPSEPLVPSRAASAFAEAQPESPQTPVRVAILEGCVQRALFAHVNDATRTVLEHNGCTVVRASGQGCCGALHAHSGALDAARALARRSIHAFERSGAEVIVVNAAGCGAMMKEYDELLRDDPDWHARANEFVSRVRDVSEFLMSRGPAAGAPIELQVTYDAPCHLLHGQGIVHAPLDLMRAIPELEIIPLFRSDECCGGAGIYGLLNPDLGGRIVGDKVKNVQETHAALVLTPNPGCIMQIGAALLLAGERTRAIHPIELLAASYKRAL